MMMRWVLQDVIDLGVHNNVLYRPNASQGSTNSKCRNDAAIQPQRQAAGLPCL